MSQPLSPDRVFDFPVDEPEPHPAYDFFASGPLPGYAGNPNNNNGWIEANVPLLRELGVVADEPMVGLIEDEIAEPIVEAEEQVIAPVVDMDEDIAMLFGDDDFKDDESEGFDAEEEVWEMVPAADRFERIGTQVEHDQQTVTLGDETMVLETSNHESTLMQCIIGMDRRLTDMERTPPRPQ
uniref:Uncharacterized protein n=1 Tax=Tanacetum cinerariifolium TaxID=118510 RepID=A0A699IDC9_TANCI|nr:hypothetical protein [Tanacetum cinerariifolium]